MDPPHHHHHSSVDQDEENLYDEFGNYLGPDLDSSDEDVDDDTSVPDRPDDASDVSMEAINTNGTGGNNNGSVSGAMVHGNSALQYATNEDTAEPMDAIVLHEDKEHYASAQQIYGEQVKTAVLDEDQIDLDTPIVQPVVYKTHTLSETETAANATATATATSPLWNYSDDYLGVQLSNETTRTRRGVALIGHLHHGKTTLVDMLLQPTRHPERGNIIGSRFTDATRAEQERCMSTQATPITALLPDTRGKSYCITILDCPGHANFHDETVAALKTVDGAILVVDCVEGLMMHTEMAMQQAVAEGLPILLVISKMDRLMVEIKLPPRDAYFKVWNIVESVNQVIRKASRGRYPPLQYSQIAFSSASHGWLFTLDSYAQVYMEQNGNLDGGTLVGDKLSVAELAPRLWGDSFLDPSTRLFYKSARDCPSRGVERTFVQYVLEPIYKIYGACLGEREYDVNKLLRSVGVLLSKDELRASARPLLQAAMSRFLQTASRGWVDMVVRHVPCPAVAASGKVVRCYSGNVTDDLLGLAMAKCDAHGPLAIHVVKMYGAPDGNSFFCFGRIYSGTVRPGEKVRILGEAYSPEDDEDVSMATVESVSIPRGRSRTNVSLAKAGNWVLLGGVDANIAKTATIVSASYNEEVRIFSPLRFPFAGGESVMKLAIEPVNPAELPKMVEGLRRVSKAYPMLRTKVEESGEHIILGTGEQYLDCVMHDLRAVYSDVEVKVADPIVAFRETVVETSSLKCFAETANRRNKLTFISEPLEEGLAEQLEHGVIKPVWEAKKLGRFFQSRYNWDLLASRSVWAFGDCPARGTNILLDDTLPGEVDKSLLLSCKSSIVQGFQWATREGPLCEEPVRGTKLKILDAVLAEKPIHRGGGQMIPTARKVVHSAMLTATPRLLEPVYRVQIQCTSAIVDAIQPVIARRRGHIVQDKAIPGSLFYSVTGYIPVLDSFGFETDVRTFSQGQAMVYSVFDHWALVPGDPLDRSIILHPLEPSPPPHLARELLLKTRRRKGLSEDVSVTKFFDEGMKANLSTQ